VNFKFKSLCAKEAVPTSFGRRIKTTGTGNIKCVNTKKQLLCGLVEATSTETSEIKEAFGKGKNFL
jgi:hypothetical protein